MAHSKLYRNFIILQEDERGYSSSNDKALSGYAKVEAKGDKCKVSFYAQNLRRNENYSMILICCKKDFKQLIDLGTLTVNEVGKGDTSKEYYINNIAGLGVSYEKISGAAICKIENGEVKAIMHGFMNGEEITDNWRKFKIVKEETADIVAKPSIEKTNFETIKSERVNNKPKENNIVNAEKVESAAIEESKNITDSNSSNGRAKLDLDDSIMAETIEDRNKCKKDKDKYKDKDKKEKCMDEKIKDIADKLEDLECDVNLDIINLKKDVVVCMFVKEKGNEKCVWKKYKTEKKCRRNESGELPNSKRIEENVRLDRIDFEEYENSIKDSNNELNFNIKGNVGRYFENIASGFEPYNEGLEDINYCKWYKVKVRSMDDLCNKSNYDKYTLAYYPMINYYPYISKEKYFLLGYKCNSTGELQYIVYAIPGSKDKSEQPYGGKTGFVTWTNNNTRSSGYWLMFYDYRKCSIVVPIK